MRTIPEMAALAYRIQDACNIRAVVRELAEMLREMSEMPECEGTDWLCNHSVTRAMVDKLASLANVQGGEGFGRAFDALRYCRKATEGTL